MSLLEIDQSTFPSVYNREPFLFHHHLAEHPLLRLSSVFELAKRHPREEILHWDGSIPVSANIDVASRTHAVPISLEDAIRNVETAGRDVRYRSQRCFINIGCEDFCPLMGEHFRRRTPNTVSCRGDQSNLASHSISHSSYQFC